MTSSSPHLRCHEHRRTAALWQRTRLNIDTSLLDLPDEIIELILSKCSVKSAVRFKSVSKSWLSIISDPGFFRMLQSRLSENQKNKFFIWTQLPSKDCYGLYLMRLEDGGFQIESELGRPFGRPLCSCDSLILLNANDDDNNYVLWNPLIRKHIIIPAFNDSSPWWHNLCFDSITDDYKIVLFYRKCYTVYSCNNGCWGEMKDLPYDQMERRSYYVDGCLYYMDYGEIICFDARDGKLHKFWQPEEAECLFDVKIEAVSERLCLYGYKNHGAGPLELWVMEENGSFDKFWRKLISMEKVESYISNKLIPLCFTGEGDVVLLATMRPPAGYIL